MRQAGLCAGLFLALSACASPAPVMLSSQYEPSERSLAWDRGPARDRVACRIYVGQTRDLRDDPQALGAIGYRSVHAADAPAWLRSGLRSLSDDPRIGLGDAPPPASDLSVEATLLKVYVETANQAKSANVVVRIRYDGPGDGPSERVYRGTYTSINWAAGESETQGALNRALTRLLEQVHHDVLGRCAATRAK